jgi:large subunit ribosomal protein L3
MKFILGEKISMTQRFADDGTVTPVTVVKAGPCVVTQVKTQDKEGYQALQLGYGAKRKPAKPQAQHLKGLDQVRYLRECRLTEAATLKRGDTINAEMFQVGDVVGVIGQSKGKGFQGVVRRHGFHGSPASHGHKDQLRMPGSIGATAPQRVVKGRRMAGHMGDDQVSIKNLKIIEIDAANNLLYIKGAVPGAKHGLLIISAPGAMTAATAPTPVAAEEKKAETVTPAPAQTAEKK